MNGGCAYNSRHPRVLLLRHWGLEDEEAAPYYTLAGNRAVAKTLEESAPPNPNPNSEVKEDRNDNAEGDGSPLSLPLNSRSPRCDTPRSHRFETSFTADPGDDALSMADELFVTFKKTTASRTDTAMSRSTYKEITLNLAERFALNEENVILFTRKAAQIDNIHFGRVKSEATEAKPVELQPVRRREALSLYVASQQEQRVKQQEKRIEWERKQMQLSQRRHEMELEEDRKA